MVFSWRQLSIIKIHTLLVSLGKWTAARPVSALLQGFNVLSRTPRHAASGGLRIQSLTLGSKRRVLYALSCHVTPYNDWHSNWTTRLMTLERNLCKPSHWEDKEVANSNTVINNDRNVSYEVKPLLQHDNIKYHNITGFFASLSIHA